MSRLPVPLLESGSRSAGYRPVERHGPATTGENRPPLPYGVSMFDPRHLRLLQEIARTGSLSAAAGELGFSQPAVSYQLRSLEREVGTVLVVRNGRTTRLTPAGEALTAHADRILSSIQTAEQNLADIVGSQSGLVRVAAFPSGCATLLPVAMAAMRRHRPAVEVRLHQAEPPVALSMVRRGEADLAVSYRYDAPSPGRRGAAREAPLRRIELLEDPVQLVLPADHPLAEREEIGTGEFRELADATWFISSQCFEGILQRAAAAGGFTPVVSTVADDYVAMQALVAHRLGVAVLPRLALAAHRDERVVSRRVRDWPPRLIEVEMWPDRLRVDAVSAMIDALRSACSHPLAADVPASPAA
jgi:molybdate transport repressor ModE-like protein